MVSHYFIKGEYLGKVEIPDDLWNRNKRNVAYFCTFCGDIWARQLIEGRERHCTQSAVCPKCFPDHPEAWNTSYIVEVHEFERMKPYLHLLPNAVLLREFIYSLATFDRMCKL